MASNWLDLMDNDSNISMSEDENTKPGMGTSSVSRASFDPELDSSRCGVNLLIKKNMNILSEDSLSRKRSLNEMKSTDIDRFIAKMSKSPPKAKQKMNAQGRWTKTKILKKESARIGFDRFLNWADRGQSGSKNNRCVLGSTSIDNKRNILNNQASGTLVTCTPNATNRRAQYRGRRTRKRSQTLTPNNQSPAVSLQRSNAEMEREQRRHDLDQAAGKQQELAVDGHNTMDMELATKENEGAETGDVAIGNDNDNEREEDKERPLKPDDVQTADDMAVEVESSTAAHPDGVRSKSPNGTVEAEMGRGQEALEQETKERDNDGDNDNGKGMDIEEEEEDIDLEQESSPGRRSRRSSQRVTPRLERVVFSEDLLFSKVPILERKAEEMGKPVVCGPVFLNADEFAEQYPVRREEVLKAVDHGEREEEDTDETTDCTKSDTTKSDSSNTVSTTDSAGDKGPDAVWADSENAVVETASKNKGGSWASRLFGSVKSAHSTEESKSEGVGISQRERKKERIHQMKIESVLPIEGDARRMMLSRDSSSSSTADLKSLQSGDSGGSQGSKESVNRMETEIETETETASSPMMASPKSSKSSTSSLQIVVPSQGATDWRQKQISYGKNTVGYRNFARKHPNKDLRFRHMHCLVSTPDAKEKIGKKRWVGKYQKWRKFLHQFDSSESGEDSD